VLDGFGEQVFLNGLKKIKERIKKMHILVTGGAGYIGTLLTERFLNEGYQVTILDNFLYRQTLPPHLCRNRKFSVEKGDARDLTTLKPLLRSADVIIPLAAIVGADACNNNRTAAESTNFSAIASLITHKSKEQRVIYPNTNSGYGIGVDDVFCTEETPLKPISLYGITKVAAEKCIMDAGNAVTLRLATVFGMSHRMRLDLLVNDFVRRAIFDKSIMIFEGHFKRNFIHISDVARAFLFMVDNFEDNKDNVYNVGLSSANISKIELAEKIKKYIPEFVIKCDEFAKDPDQRNYIVSNSKIEEKGFMPLCDLDEGIVELIKGIKVLYVTNYSNI
jgi:nucleoside-diphosphate-sugar epimerase